MVTTLRSLPRRSALALVLAMMLSSLVAFSTLAEDIYPYGSANSHMYTHAADWINGGGAYEWRAEAYTVLPQRRILLVAQPCLIDDRTILDEAPDYC